MSSTRWYSWITRWFCRLSFFENRNHLNSSPETPPHSSFLRRPQRADGKIRQYSCWHDGRCRYHAPNRVWFLPLFSCRYPGHIATFALSCALGRQSVHSRRTAVSHLPIVSHVCTLYTLSINSSACVLRSSGSVPCTIPSRRERARQVR